MIIVIKLELFILNKLSKIMFMFIWWCI